MMAKQNPFSPADLAMKRRAEAAESDWQTCGSALDEVLERLPTARDAKGGGTP